MPLPQRLVSHSRTLSYSIKCKYRTPDSVANQSTVIKAKRTYVAIYFTDIKNRLSENKGHGHRLLQQYNKLQMLFSGSHLLSNMQYVRCIRGQFSKEFCCKGRMGKVIKSFFAEYRIWKVIRSENSRYDCIGEAEKPKTFPALRTIDRLPT